MNPTDALDYNWSGDEVETTSTAPLRSEHVVALFNTAEDTREKLLVDTLFGWGLRSGEVAALHAHQLVLHDAPRIEFESCKTGPGSVALIYGQDVVKNRIAEFADDDDWRGYLLPSPRPSRGHRTGGTIRNWFDDLAEQANLPETIGGHRPVPQMARRFWYDRYSSTVEDFGEHQIQEVAEEQGRPSATVVWDDYLSEDRRWELRREFRREFMQEKLADAFELPAAERDQM